MASLFRRNVETKLQPAAVTRWVQQDPMLRLGFPFMLGVVVMSVVLTEMFATRFEWDDQQKGQLDQREALGLKGKPKTLDLREEYFRLSGAVEQNWKNQEWENKRVPRLPGQAEWGDNGAERYREVPGSRWQPGQKPSAPPPVNL